MSLRLLLRFGDLFNPSPPGLEELPDWLRRDILGDDRAAGVPDARSAQAPTGDRARHAAAGSRELPGPRRRFSFRMHPVSELSYLWERLPLASFPRIGDRPA